MAEKPAAKPPVTPVHVGGESFLDRLVPHMKKIVIGIGIIIAIVGVLFIIKWRKEKKQVKATDGLAQVLHAAALEVRPDGVPLDKTKPTYANRAERGTAVLDAITKSGGQPGDLVQATALYEAGKTDEALAAYQKAASLPGVEGAIAREGVGLCLEAKAMANNDAAAKGKGLEEALTAFRAVETDDTAPRRVYALYHEARVLMLLEKKSEAKAVFEKAKALAKGTGVEQLIQARLESLEMM